jgi:carbonic anhydrase/acetyltransferase-like protein (isoleucine patch superfamily)
MPIHTLGERRPTIDATAYVAEGARVIGDVLLAAESSVWFNAVLRGDTERISIGAGSNIQDGAILHADPGFPCSVGAGVVTGHGAILHGCRIGDNCLIGMGAIVLNGATIGEGSIVAAGAVIPEGKEYPPGSLIMGIPGKAVRDLTDEDRQQIAEGASHYQERARIYRAQLGKA